MSDLPADLPEDVRLHLEAVQSMPADAIPIDLPYPVEATPTEYLMDRMRVQRNKALADSDWTQVDDAPISAESKAAWATYRQALRDFPASWTPTWYVVLPATP